MRKENFLTESDHYKNANLFISSVLGDVVRRFNDLKIEANNETNEDLDMLPGMIEVARLEGDLSMTRELRDDDRNIESESASSTRVFVSINGDNKKRIQEATSLINKTARQFKGSLQNDSGTNQSGTGQGLDKILGHRPEHEDLPLLTRYLNYVFK